MRWIGLSAFELGFAMLLNTNVGMLLRSHVNGRGIRTREETTDAATCEAKAETSAEFFGLDASWSALT